MELLGEAGVEVVDVVCDVVFSDGVDVLESCGCSKCACVVLESCFEFLWWWKHGVSVVGAVGDGVTADDEGL